MDKIHNSELRVGKFTSSQIYRLCGLLKSGNPTKAFETYAEEVYFERLAGCSINSKVKTRSMAWGKLMEIILHQNVSFKYKMKSQNTIIHKNFDFWSGTPDLDVPGVKTGEIKCFELLHFMQLSTALMTKNTEFIKKNEPAVYWQSISNSLLKGYDYTEIISYIPRRSELIEIIEMINTTEFLNDNDLNPWEYYFMDHVEKVDELPHLPDESPFGNLHTFEFVIPEEDAQFLINRVCEAEELVKKHLDA